ncbi:hypothetical protein CROQUDRAFT_103115 [Cronartium quercuum f. sp. fusiforme G11]|uniref:Uncharacterized protein n=1 Tax=Cronartium quercuum f. sp. fusiforme G11 TaxID=708437 RepID=A0A9P6NRN3_9BASI|nr:hypothetical protein CROQUDRAFT_103115 [Cronartium quercuum f. sp. fusiforme G11]
MEAHQKHGYHQLSLNSVSAIGYRAGLGHNRHAKKALMRHFFRSTEWLGIVFGPHPNLQSKSHRPNPTPAAPTPGSCRVTQIITLGTIIAATDGYLSTHPATHLPATVAFLQSSINLSKQLHMKFSRIINERDRPEASQTESHLQLGPRHLTKRLVLEMRSRSRHSHDLFLRFLFSLIWRLVEFFSRYPLVKIPNQIRKRHYTQIGKCLLKNFHRTTFKSLSKLF